MSHLIPTKTLAAGSSKGFSFLPGINRTVKPGHVSKMAQSIASMGILRPVIVATMNFIDGTKQTYIIDGQHLYLAGIRLNTDMEYKEIVIKDMKELIEKIALLNNSSKSWTLQDYIVAWQNLSADYKTLMTCFNTYDIEMCQLGEILHYGITLRVAPGSSTIVKVIKDGNFKIKDYKSSKVLLDYITDMLKVTPRLDRLSNRALVSSYAQFVTTHSNYQHTNFIQKLKQNTHLFKLSTQDSEEFKKLFESL
jgi:hypothetical protein